MEPTAAEQHTPAEQEAHLAEIKRRRKVIIFDSISFLIVLLALAWAIVTYFHLDRKVYTNDAQVESYINPINTRIPGYIKEIRFTEHQRVKKGDTLVIIDDREYKILVKQAQAVVTDAAAGKSVVNSTEDVSRNGVDISEANIDETAARLKNAEINYQRYANLVKEDVVTQFQFDQVKADRDALKARYLSLQRSKQGAKLATQENNKRIEVAQANILKASAALDYTSLNLSYTVITAPYDGTLGRRIIEEGQYIQPGQTLVSIVRGDEKWITANYTESQLAYLSVGQKVKIHIDALAEKTFIGQVSAVSEATGSRYSSVPVDNSTGNFVKVQQRFPVKINLMDNNPAKDIALLRTGMNAEVELLK